MFGSQHVYCEVLAMSQRAIFRLVVSLTTLGLLGAVGLADPVKATPPQKNNSIYLDVRTFGGDEGITYFSAGAKTDFDGKCRLVARTTLAKHGHTTVTDGSGAVIHHGGNDFELGVEHDWTPDASFTGYVGLAYADTPAQDKKFAMTGRLDWHHSMDANSQISANVRAVGLDSNTIVGIGAGWEYETPEGGGFSAKGTDVVAGENTRSTFDGKREKRNLYETAVRYTPKGSTVTYSVGYSNTLGRTTGFGLTPSLGNTGGVFFTLSGKM